MSKHGTPSSVPGWFIEFQAAILRALPKDIDRSHADRWARNGELVSHLLKPLVQKCRIPIDPKRIVHFGLPHGSMEKEGMMRVLKNGGGEIDTLAEQLILQDEFIVTTAFQNLQLLPIRPSELGFKQKVTWDRIVRRLNDVGLRECPHDVACKWLCSYDVEGSKRLPFAEEAIVYMEVFDLPTTPAVFTVQADGQGRYLRIYRIHPEKKLAPEIMIVVSVPFGYSD